MDKRSILFVICLTAAFFGVHLWFDTPQNQEHLASNQKEIKQTKSSSQAIEPETLIAAFNLNAMSPRERNEEFYVLENEYQQLVFSTLGGSLAEINLPFKSPQDPKSIVREIDIDRQILKQSPQNGRFPLYPFYKISEHGKTLQPEGSLGGYYPLLRRPLLDADGKAAAPILPEYYALNIVDEDPALARVNYKVTRFESQLIQFQASVGNRRITKTFFIPEERQGPYCFQLDLQIEGTTEDLWISSGVPDVELVGGSYSPLLRYQTLQSNISDVSTIDLPKKGAIASNQRANWISNSNGFLGVILDPLQTLSEGYKVAQIEGTKLPTRLSLIDPGYHLYPEDKYPGYATYLPVQSGSSSFRAFAGPYDESLFKDLDKLYDEPKTHYNPEYTSAQYIQGWFSFISRPFAKFLFVLMQFFYFISRSWAASIILLTIALRVMMYPLNAWSIRSSLKMQEIAPKIKAIQEKYKKDPRKAQLEVMNLYKESKANPLVGCIPMLLQMPFLIGMFYLLKSSFPLRGAPFIPGWIDDLAAPDILFTWNQPLWFIGNEFHLLPILMGVAMFIQQKMTSKIPKDTSQLNESQKQQQMLGYMMPVLFTVMFYGFPSGLNIYFMFSTLLGVLQQWWMTKHKDPKVSITVRK
jgi:YidC/Oxa1 family membrane protein insertase